MMTAPTGLGLTVSADVPVFPSTAAAIVTVPGPTPVTNPVDDTVAREASLVDQATGRPARVPPWASLGTAVSCSVCVTTTSSAEGVTATFATGTDDTVTATTADFPSLVAEMTAPPGATAVMSPVALTVATAVALLDHAMPRSDKAPPVASNGSAVICFAAPTSNPTSPDGVIRIVVTAFGFTVTSTTALLPSAVAATWTGP